MSEGMRSCDVWEATHVKVDGKIKRIKEKYGVYGKTNFAKPSEGGFGVITEDGQDVGMWNAQRYYKETTKNNSGH